MPEPSGVHGLILGNLVKDPTHVIVVLDLLIVGIVFQHLLHGILPGSEQPIPSVDLYGVVA